MVDRDTMDSWHHDIKKLKDVQVGLNVRLMTAEFYSVNAALYNNEILPWQKAVSQTIPRQDLEVIAQASRLFDIQEDLRSETDEESEVLDEEDSSTLEYEEMEALEDVLEKSLSDNRDLRARLSDQDLAVYNTFKGRKQFQLRQNMVAAESQNFSFLLNLDTNHCPYFDDVTNRFCSGTVPDGCVFCSKHQSFENTATMRTLKKLNFLSADKQLGHWVAKDIFRQAVIKRSDVRWFQDCPSVEGAGPAWKRMVNNLLKWLEGCFEVYEDPNAESFETFPFERLVQCLTIVRHCGEGVRL